MLVEFKKDIIEFCARASLIRLCRMQSALKYHKFHCKDEYCLICEQLSACEAVIRWNLHIQASNNDKQLVSRKWFGKEQYNQYTWFRE